MRHWLAIVFALACSPALAQSPIRQSGHVTPGHIVQWTTNGVVQDGGSAANGTLSSIGTTGLGPTICANSGPVTGPYQQTCIGSTSTGGLLSLQNYGGAVSGTLAVTANGTSLFSLGSTGTNFTAPILFNGALPSSASATVLCETSAGVLSFGCASGGGGGGVTSLNTLTGALSITAGSNITVTPSGSSIQISATGSGTGTVNSGTANQLGYYATSGTAISGLSGANNGILITNGSGAPSWGTQSGLTTASSLTSATVPVFISTGAVQQATVGTLQAGTGISITGTTTVSIGLNGTISGASGIFATASGTLINGHCVSINNGSFIDAGGACTTGGGGGTVSSGLGNQLAYYATNGTIVGGLATCANGIYGTTAGSVPQCETTLPAGLTIGNLILSGTLTAASLSTVGTVAGALCQTSAGLVLYEAGTNCYSSSLVVGGSSVTGGTANYFLTTGTGTLANVAPTGTGFVVLAGSPNIVSPTIITSFTATGLVTTADLASQVANTVLGAVAVGSPAALAVPSCSTASSALTWTTGTGFGCNSISGGGGTITAGTTATSGITSGHIIGSSGNLVVDSGTPYPAAASTYAYPYGFGNGGCFTGTTCTVPTGQVAANGVYKGTASNAIAYLWDNNRFVNNNSIPIQVISFNPLGVEDGNSSIPSQTYSAATFSLRFTSSFITGSPVTVTYTGTGGDTAATVATKLCNAVIANTNLSSATTGLPVVCDANQGGGGFNLQWSVLVNPMTVTSVGTGIITLPATENNLDGIFRHWDRAISGYTPVAGDAIGCDSYEFNSQVIRSFCDLVVSNAGGTALVTDLVINVSQGSVGSERVAEFSQGMILDCPQGDASPAFAGTGTIDICNSTFGGGIYFANSGGAADARIFENVGTSLIFSSSSAFLWQSTGGANYMDLEATNSGFTVSVPVFLNSVPASGGNQYLCRNTTTGEISGQASC